MMTHPYSIYVWQPKKRGGEWGELLLAYTEQYALYVANLIHQDSRAVIKVVRYGVTLASFPDVATVEKIERFLSSNTGHTHESL